MSTNYKGDKNKLVSSDYLYNQLKIYNLIISDKIKDIYSLTSQMKYSTVATYAELQAIDLETITNVTIMNVQKDETHLNVDGNPLVSLYLVFPRMSDTEPPTMTFIGSLNMSQAVIQKMLEKALFIWIPEHYEQSTNSTPNALEVVADDATLTDGQIKLSDVTPVLPDTYTPQVGDYVLLVEEKNSNVPKFVTRNEINVTTVGKFSSQVENEGADDEKEILLWNGKKIEAESVDTITKDETKVITSGGVYNGLHVEKTQTVIDTPAYYSVCQSSDDGALNVVLTVSDTSTEIALDDIFKKKYAPRMKGDLYKISLLAIKKELESDVNDENEAVALGFNFEEFVSLFDDYFDKVNFSDKQKYVIEKWLNWKPSQFKYEEGNEKKNKEIDKALKFLTDLYIPLPKLVEKLSGGHPAITNLTGFNFYEANKKIKRDIDKGMNPYDNDTKNFSFSKKGVDNGSTKILKSIAKDVVLKLNKKGS